MELKVNAVAIPEALTFNYEELKNGVLEKVAIYETMVYTEDQIKEAKADRANLNRLKKALNDERIRMEKEYMQPFTDFKNKINEIIRIIDKPVAVIDKQIKAAEDQQREDKMKQIEEFWNGRVVPDGIHLHQVMDPKWLNATVSMKSIRDAIVSRLEQISNDLAVVRSLPSYQLEAERVYLSTLDLGRAVSEAQKLQELAEKKAAAAAAMEKAAMKPTAIPEPVPVAEAAPVAEPEEEPARQWIGFQALLSVEEARALGNYMKANGIKYKAI